MGEPDHDYQPIMADGLSGQDGIVDLAFHQAEFGVPFGDRFGDLGGVADLDVDVDARVGLSVGRDSLGKPVAGDGLAGVHGKLAPLQSPQIGQGHLRRSGAGENGSSFIQENETGLVQDDIAANPVEQTDVMTRLERGDGGADCRLGQVEFRRSLGDVLAFGHRDEDPELFEGHQEALRSVGATQPQWLKITATLGEPRKSMKSRALGLFSPFGVRATAVSR